MTCPHCQQGAHLLNGIHSGESWFAPCERTDYVPDHVTELTLEPMTQGPKVRDTWHQPKKRKDLPFVYGGAA